MTFQKLHCALIAAALLCLSGCCNENSYRDMAESCAQKGGTFCYSCESFSLFSASVTVSCKGISQPYLLHDKK
jgi:hypothetical protein